MKQPGCLPVGKQIAADSLGKNKRIRRSELPTKRHRDGKRMIPGERGLPRQPKRCLVPAMTLDTTKGRSKHEERMRNWKNRQESRGLSKQ